MSEGSALQVRGSAERPSERSSWRRTLALALLGLAVLDVAAAVWVHARLETSVRRRGHEGMRSLLDAEAASASAWFEGRRASLEFVRVDAAVNARAREALAPEADGQAGERLRSALARLGLEADRWALVSPQGGVVLGTPPLSPGPPSREVAERLAAAPVGRASVVLPLRFEGGQKLGLDVVPVAEGAGWLLRPVPLQDFLAGPFRGAALLGSGEVYAFNTDGWMLSESRFPEQLRRAGVLGAEAASTVLEVEVRDPGVRLATGARPGALRKSLPFTRPVQAAIAGADGEDFVGYRDYRGELSFGLWRWFPEEGYGLVVEVDQAEALEPVRLQRPLLLALVAAVGALLMGALWLFFLYRRAERRAQAFGEAARQLGQYQLVRKLGEGGMGVVYEAHHALLHRPAAIKLMRPSRFSDGQAARFEREVQATAALAHPNTISVFDYGKAEDGTFYYVMELLEGCDLERLVQRTGPLPAGRVAHVLRQICGSLAEAHQRGLVHRDVKPANVFLTSRAAVYDVVKLLDFGLVRSADAQKAGLTEPQLLMGTPLYMAPELFDGAEHASPASDLYAVGALATWLLTGQPLFDDRRSLSELMMDHRTSRPHSPSVSLGRPVDAALERFIAACLAKRPGDRPLSAESALELLDAVQERWSAVDARRWWEEHAADLAVAPPIDVALDVTMEARPR